MDNMKLINDDCMDVMKDYPDKYFDLAPVDVQYGINQGGKKNDTRGKLATAKTYHSYNDNKPPEKEYFKELFRVSKNQIVFGANHFIENMPVQNSPCWIVWDKDNGETDYADCELAWTSFKGAVRKFEFKWQGMLQGNMKNKEVRIHPNQKPVALYRWMFEKFAKPNFKMIDTHAGSMSSIVAWNYFQNNGEIVACEKEKIYFDLAVDRIEKETRQLNLFQDA